MRLHTSLVPFTLLLGSLCAQDEEADKPALPQGPGITYVDAFPAQAGFERPLYVAFTATDPQHAYVVTQNGFVFAVPRDGSTRHARYAPASIANAEMIAASVVTAAMPTTSNNGIATP